MEEGEAWVFMGTAHALSQAADYRRARRDAKLGDDPLLPLYEFEYQVRGLAGRRFEAHFVCVVGAARVHHADHVLAERWSSRACWHSSIAGRSSCSRTRVGGWWAQEARRCTVARGADTWAAALHGSRRR